MDYRYKWIIWPKETGLCWVKQSKKSSPTVLHSRRKLQSYSRAKQKWIEALRSVASMPKGSACYIEKATELLCARKFQVRPLPHQDWVEISMPVGLVTLWTPCITITSILLKIARLKITKQAPKESTASIEATRMSNSIEVSHQLVQESKGSVMMALHHVRIQFRVGDGPMDGIRRWHMCWVSFRGRFSTIGVASRRHIPGRPRCQGVRVDSRHKNDGLQSGCLTTSVLGFLDDGPQGPIHAHRCYRMEGIRR